VTTGLVLIKTGSIPVARPHALVLHLLRFALLCYLPLIAASWATIRGRIWGLGGGLFLSLALSTILMAHVTGAVAVDMGGLLDDTNAPLKRAADAFFLVLAALLLVFYSLALVAWFANRRR
jgi:hypothetical protein